MTRVGLLLPGFDRGVAIAAEQHGFHSLWLRDGPLHGSTLLGALAAVTSTARLGVIVDITGRNAAIVAKQLTTLDRMSHGRASLAIAATDDAGAEEAVRAARATFRDDHLNHPAPQQPGGPPIAVIDAPAVAARHADGAVLVGDAAELEAQLALLARHCAQSARDPATLSTLWFASGSPTPVAMAETAAAAGIDEVVLDMGHAGADAVADAGRAVRRVTGVAQ